MKKRKYVLMDAQTEKYLELAVAFEETDGIQAADQILCYLSEDSVVDLMERYNYGVIPYQITIDVNVQEYINKKYNKPMLLND